LSCYMIREIRFLPWIAKIAAFVSGGLLLLATGLAYESPETEKSVLVLYGERGDLPAIEAIEENIHELFHASVSPRIDLYSEYLDFTRFATEQHERSLVRYLQERYAGRRIDMVIPVVGSALSFALAHRAELFPGAPMVFCAIDQRELDELRLPPDVTGIAAHFDFERTIGLIIQLQPNVPEIICVSGAGGFDRRWAEETRKIIERRYSRIHVRWIAGKSLAETVKEVSRLPRASAVFFISMLRDGDGHSTSSVDVVRDLANVSQAPVYGASSQFLDAGVIGGAMFDFGANGRNTAEIALKALRGEWVPYGAPETESHNPLEINFRAFRKAGLPEWRLPKEAKVLFRPPGLWETHRRFILLVAGAVLFQAALIAILVAERLWRRRAEASLRQSEQRLSLMLEASPNGIALANEQGRIMLVNTRAEELFGYSRGEFIGQNLEILVPARFRSANPANHLQSPDEQAGRRFEARREIFAQRKDGSEFPAEIGISPIRSKEGILVLAVVTDISARRHAEAEARRYHEELAHLSRVEILGEMAGSLAHELNQPLTAIMNNASAGRRFIAKGLADMPKLDGLLQSIVADVRRAGEIIRGIRSMVRKSAGARGPVDLNTVIADVMTMVHADAVARNCVVVTELQPKLPLVNADRVQLQQVLMNIIVNAFDAMCHLSVPERRAIVRTESESGGGVRASVRDFGPGLPTENPQRIFDRFFSTKRDGLGVGLAIARSIVSSHGGELVAENAEGGGAFVYFSLPGFGESAG
jgi:PAS domain S-box-containing protein